MKPKFYVIDTSYLLEVAACGRDSQPHTSKAVRERLQATRAAGGRFYVPLPCLFELGDHIADVVNGTRRKELAEWLVSTVEQCLREQTPWHITPTASPNDVLPPLLAKFAEYSVKNNAGLVDTFAAMEAQRLKSDFADLKAVVHIWTNDRSLKALEPDTESDPLLW
jgi:hypothetical protein